MKTVVERWDYFKHEDEVLYWKPGYFKILWKDGSLKRKIKLDGVWSKY